MKVDTINLFCIIGVNGFLENEIKWSKKNFIFRTMTNHFIVSEIKDSLFNQLLNVREINKRKFDRIFRVEIKNGDLDDLYLDYEILYKINKDRIEIFHKDKFKEINNLQK